MKFIAYNLDAIIKAQGLDKILSLLQSTNEEIIAITLGMIWVAADSGSKYQNAIHAANDKLLVSIFAIIPKLLLHYEETIALNATGAMCALAEHNSKLNSNILSLW